MNIQDALKNTGKAKRPLSNDYYAAIDEEDVLRWYGQDVHNKANEVQLSGVLADDWQPYHPKEEIMPSEAGELWGNEELYLYTEDYQKSY